MTEGQFILTPSKQIGFYTSFEDIESLERSDG